MEKRERCAPPAATMESRVGAPPNVRRVRPPFPFRGCPKEGGRGAQTQLCSPVHRSIITHTPRTRTQPQCHLQKMWRVFPLGPEKEGSPAVRDTDGLEGIKLSEVRETKTNPVYY